jgi:hypothetical protein
MEKVERKSLYEITGNIKDFNTFIVSKRDLDKLIDAEYTLELRGYAYTRNNGWYLPVDEKYDGR